MLLPDRKRPWVVLERRDHSCFMLKDAVGYRIAAFYFATDGEAKLGYLRRDEAEEAAQAFRLLSIEDETTH